MVRLLLTTLLYLTLSVSAKKETGPHPHQGLSKPYLPGKPDTVLGSKDLKQLQEGKLVQQSLKSGSGAGRALAVQDLHAPPDYVWDRILDFPNYPKMVPKVVKCHNYQIETFRNGTEAIKTNMVMKVFGVKFDNYIYHTYFKRLSSLTWTLDYSRRSTLDDSVGYWHVEPAPDRPIDEAGEWSRVYYSCLLRVPKWVPGIVVNFLEKKAVSEANMWLKREAESKYAKDRASGRSLGSNTFRGLFKTGGGVSALNVLGFTQGLQPTPQVQEIDTEEEDEDCLNCLNLAKKAATYGVVYGLGWFMHSRKSKREQ